MKVVWLSDLHFVTEGLISGYDPRARLQAAVDHINTHCSDCAFCVISGDLTDTGAIEDYSGAKAILDGLELPYFVMMGNHDEHGAMRAVFDLPTNAMADFAQFLITTDVGQFVCLDTKAERSNGGYLCHQRLSWLDRILGEIAGSPVYLFLHHPPVSLNLAPFDEIGLRNSNDLIDIVTRHDCIVHIFAGHVHQSITGQVRGIPFAITGSTTYHSPPPLPRWGWDDFRPHNVPPEYSVIHFNRQDVVVQTVPFCNVEFGRVE